MFGVLGVGVLSLCDGLVEICVHDLRLTLCGRSHQLSPIRGQRPQRSCLSGLLSTRTWWNGVGVQAVTALTALLLVNARVPLHTCRLN